MIFPEPELWVQRIWPSLTLLLTPDERRAILAYEVGDRDSICVAIEDQEVEIGCCYLETEGIPRILEEIRDPKQRHPSNVRAQLFGAAHALFEVLKRISPEGAKQARLDMIATHPNVEMRAIGLRELHWWINLCAERIANRDVK